MNGSFSFTDVRSVEFGVCHDLPEGERHVHVPVDNQVQDALKEMLSATVRALRVGVEELGQFELAEQYRSTERLAISLDLPYTGKLRALLAAENLKTNTGAIGELETLVYYFATFRDRRKRKLLGVRRAGQFKGIVKARNRLIRWIDDSLKLVGDDIFKLDQDFDYLLAGNAAWILHPSGFEYTAGIEEAIPGRVAEMIATLEEGMPGIDFSAFSDYIVSHSRARRLLGALHSRADMRRTSGRRLRLMCKANEIAVTTEDGRVVPQAGSEQAFLEMLDRRRYPIELIENEKELYVASGRKRAREHPTGRESG